MKKIIFLSLCSILILCGCNTPTSQPNSDHINLSEEESSTQSSAEQKRSEESNVSQTSPLTEESMSSEPPVSNASESTIAASDESAQDKETPPATSVENTNSLESTVDASVEPSITYILNTSSMKIHKLGCRSLKTLSEENRATTALSLSELKDQGYSTCGNCFK